jgi:N-methylhydantoinase B
MAIAHRVVTCLKRALVDAIPDRLAAASNDCTNFITMSYRSGGRYEMFSESVAGGIGACSVDDGEDVISQTIVNTANTPIECIENDHSFVRVQSYGVARDSGGPGEFRGGLGALRVYEILKDGVLLSTSGDRHGSQPWGMAGGGAASRSTYTIMRGADEIRIPAIATIVLQAGDRFVVRLAGGGGYGDPKRRGRNRVIEDFRSGRISRAAAIDIYGLDGSTLPQ